MVDEFIEDNSYKFFTIGYEGKNLDDYLNQLIQNNVKLLCDVRKNPVSRKRGFSKSALSAALNKFNIEYIHLSALGIVSEKRKNLKTQEDFNRLFNEYENTTLLENRKVLEKLFQIFLDKKRVAITCFEAEPSMCHRSSVVKLLSKFPDWKYETINI